MITDDLLKSETSQNGTVLQHSCLLSLSGPFGNITRKSRCSLQNHPIRRGVDLSQFGGPTLQLDACIMLDASTRTQAAIKAAVGKLIEP